jgi:transcriptional regulator with GAF, ATPase, and Fis domain
VELPTDTRAAAVFFARISAELMEEKAELSTLRRIVERAVDVVPACDHSGISLRRRHHRVETLATSSEVAATCDALQYELEEGPCLDAIWQEACYLTTDTSNDNRWPRWGPRVAEQGVGSVLSIRLSTSTETLGALNLYADEVDAFGRDDVDLAMIYAQHATNAMSAALLVSGLRAAVDGRHVIGVAQGILMSEHGLDLQQAFEVLRRYSNHANVKLREVAAHVVENGSLPAMEALAVKPAQRPPRVVLQ